MRLVDLSTCISNDAITEIRPSKVRYITHEMEESWKKFTELFECEREDLPNNGLGNAVEVLTAGSHVSTHMDAPFHYGPITEGKPSKTIDQIPLEWCYGDGVVLDFRRFGDGHVITAQEVEEELAAINYTIKPGDIVFIMTGCDKKMDSKAYFEQPGMGRESVLYLAARGVKIMGIDAWGFDTSFAKMKEAYRESRDNSVMWQAHHAGNESEYCHIEKLVNLDQLPPHGFKVCCFPIKIEHGSAGWVRVVAFVDD